MATTPSEVLASQGKGFGSSRLKWRCHTRLSSARRSVAGSCVKPRRQAWQVWRRPAIPLWLLPETPPACTPPPTALVHSRLSLRRLEAERVLLEHYIFSDAKHNQSTDRGEAGGCGIVVIDAAARRIRCTRRPVAHTAHRVHSCPVQQAATSIQAPCIDASLPAEYLLHLEATLRTAQAGLVTLTAAAAAAGER